MIKLTIIIPVYNVERYLGRCLDSVCRQGFEKGELEVLLIDDGSKDGSNRIAQEYALRFPFIRVLRKDNGGLSSARNYGIDHAQGKYVMFLDSDDYIAESVLAGLVERIERENLDFLGYGLRNIINGQITDKITEKHRPDNYCVIDGATYLREYDMVISACMHIVRRDIYGDELRFTEGVLHEDYAFMLHLYERTKRMGFTDTVVYFYDVKGTGTISTTRSMAQKIRYNQSWEVELKALKQWLTSLKADAFKEQAIRTYNGYCYMALTSLLLSEIPWSEKHRLYKGYSQLGVFRLGRTNLSVKRSLRKILYAIRPLYYLAMRFRVC